MWQIAKDSNLNFFIFSNRHNFKSVTCRSAKTYMQNVILMQ